MKKWNAFLFFFMGLAEELLLSLSTNELIFGELISRYLWIPAFVYMASFVPHQAGSFHLHCEWHQKMHALKVHFAWIQGPPLRVSCVLLC